VRAKVAEYMDRAEKLKTWIAEEGGNKKKPAAMGSNGKAGGGGSGYANKGMSYLNSS
jgi:vacuolar protein-sorting-associated protein 4